MKCNNTTTCLMSEHLNRGRKWKLIMQYLQFLLSSIDKTECSLSDWVYYGETCPPRLSSQLVICEVFFQGIHRYSSQVKYKLNSYKKNWMIHLNALDASLALDIIFCWATNIQLQNQSPHFSKQESRAKDLACEKEIAVLKESTLSGVISVYRCFCISFRSHFRPSMYRSIVCLDGGLPLSLEKETSNNKQKKQNGKENLGG